MQSFYCDQGHILLTRFNFDPSWISNHKPSKVWGEITFQTCTAEAWGWISNFHNGCIYLSMLGLKLNHVSKRGHRIVSPKAHWIILLTRLAHIMFLLPLTVVCISPWWRHQIEIFSALLAICAGNSPVTGEFLAQRPVTWSFDIFFDLHLHKRLSKQSWGWWFETLSHPLWRHCNAMMVCCTVWVHGTQVRFRITCLGVFAPKILTQTQIAP